MRIAYFAETFPSASETWVHHEIHELLKLGCAVRVFATHPRPARIPAELEQLAALTTYLPEVTSRFRDVVQTRMVRALKTVVAGLLADCAGIRSRAQVLRDFLFTCKFSAPLAAYDPDFLIAHFGGTRANLALMWSEATATPFAVKFHAYDVFHRMALLRTKMKRAARALTISRFNVKYVQEHYRDVDAARLEVHKCGIPLDKYPFRPKPAHDALPTVMATGRLVPMKGFHVLLRASALLIERGFAHRVRIHGSGPELPRLTSLINDLGLHETVEMAGYGTSPEIRAALAEADMFVMPSVFDPVEKMDGIPVSLMEAMATGVPVISSRISGIPELVEDRVTGFLSEPDDAESLAAAMLECSRLTPAGRDGLVTAARRKIEAEHNAATLAAELNRSLRACLNGSRA